MARNQKRAVSTLRWQTFGFVLFAVGAVAGMTLGYVLQRKAHLRLGEQVGPLERRAQELGSAVQQQRVLQAQLSAPAQLRQRMQELGLGLVSVNPTQRLFVGLPALNDPPVPVPVEGAHRGVARAGFPLAGANR